MFTIPNCLICNEQLNYDIINDHVLTFRVVECKLKHYRCHVSTPVGVIRDFTDVKPFCIRRNFQHIKSDIIKNSDPFFVSEYDTPIEDSRLVSKYDRIITDDEVRDAIKRLNRLGVLS